MTKTLFDHITAIQTIQTTEYFDGLDDAELKTFNLYMINRFLSMIPEYLLMVAFFSRYYGTVGQRETYLFYSSMFPQGRKYKKYIKATEKEDTYEQWLIDLVAKYFYVSEKDAIDYITLFYLTPEGKIDLREICENHGVDAKKLKKVKL